MLQELQECDFNILTFDINPYLLRSYNGGYTGPLTKKLPICQIQPHSTTPQQSFFKKTLKFILKKGLNEFQFQLYVDKLGFLV